ncbi:hypothetical protein P691DRAFT_808625 [Macrolepiota fuliginosa MF-IS2]|uniref:Uncharacterized protein n=1 Tax=Macrolepiota fuliginosa MF-IS2 TaxID=1400762 RepID=A0A9P5XQ45_9AGAR|nr:hypothetical protein P691DRAFT_808625 [Macrolepiota fuliginosa MF-IS2]
MIAQNDNVSLLVGLEGSEKPIWSVVAYSDSSPKIPSLRQADTRPRLWTGTRKELASTFTELSGSKCVNNISWSSTDMPILILDDEFMSVNKPDSTGGEFHMDVSMIREFVCVTESASSQRDDVDLIPTRAVVTPNENIPNDISLSQLQIPSARPPSGSESQPQQIYEQKSTAPTSAYVLDISPPPAGSANTTEILASGAARAPTSKAKGAISEQVKPLEPPPLESHSASAPQPPRAQAKAARTTLSSLRFKKIKKTSPDTPANPDASLSPGRSPLPTPSPSHDSPQPGVGSASELSLLQVQADHASPPIRPTTSSLPVPYLSRSTMSNPPQAPPTGPLESSKRHTPDAPMSEPEMISYKQAKFEPVFNYYSDNHFLSQLPETFVEKHAMSLPTSLVHGPAKDFRVDAIQPGGFVRVKAPADRVVVLRKLGGCADTDSHQLPVGAECRCSRFRYDHDCSFCRVHVPANEKPPSPDTQLDDNTEKARPTEVGIRQLVGPATYPNDIPLGRVRIWGREPAVGFAFPSGVGKQTNIKYPDTGHSPLAAPRELPTVPVPDSCAGDTSGLNARPILLEPRRSAVAIGNTVNQTRDQRVVPTPAPYTTYSHNAPGVTLAPGPISNFHQPVYLTTPSEAHPPNPVTQKITQNSVLDKSPEPSLTPAPPPPESSVVSGKRTASASLKRKGKEKAPDLESSEDEPLALGIKHQRIAKRPKLHGSTVDEHRAPHGYMGINLQTVPIACSSKTKTEDLPVMPSTQTSLQVGVRVSNEEKKEVPQASISAAGKPVKRRGRPPKSVKAAANTSQPAEQPAPMQVDSGAPQPQHLPQPTSKPKSRAGLKPQAVLAPVSSVPVRRGANGVPMPIPAEIQALVDAYVNGVPIGVFAAKKYVQGLWGLKLTQEEEVGYAFMGFYRISRLLESLMGDSSDGEGGTDDGRGRRVVGAGVSRAKVRWRFRMKWEPGGEDWQVHERDDLSSPWWNPLLKAQGLSALPRSDLEDSDNESTMMYRLARRSNPNFARRRCFFNQAFYSVLPLHLLAPINAEIPDSALPRGWHCKDCGKLNFRYYLRHRRCSSSYCKDKPEVEGYAVDIDRMRDPQDSLPLSLPLSEMPSQSYVDFKVQTWSDRMKTLVYQFKVGSNGNRGPAAVQHIFTGNLKDLQRDPSQLLSEIQIHVPLRRPTGDASSNPYFTYFAGDGKGADGKFVPWEAAPGCLQRAKELVKSRGWKYGKKPVTELDIRSLEIRAWVTTGSRRSPDLLSATQRCMAIMCLGCEVIISINPKSAIISDSDQPRMSDLDELIPMEGFDPEDKLKMEAQSGEGVKMEVEEVGSAPRDTKDQTQSLSMPSTKAVPRGRKVEKVVLSVSLLHGDILLLEGDDFEYSIKRTGTSILLFGW